MEKIQFKCELLSDIVLNDSPATEGKRKCLDFISGNNFLGIVASQLYKETDETSWLIFHSGNVRFGDAHPSFNGIRSLRVPSSFYYPKLKKIDDACYVHHFVKHDDEIKALQLKQCRSDFYVFSEQNEAIRVKVLKDFSIKSAYDSDLRRAKDSQMFGYEALCKGLVMYFSIEIDENALHCKDSIVNAICGKHHIGRSRSAQYGRVEISTTSFKEVETTKQPILIGNEQYIAVYADSRLIFFDENGNNTFQPKPIELGIEDKDAEIDWNLSQIRTFQYAPWNYKRQAFDAERCGIEKGSVFLVKAKNINIKSNTIGFYKNEGFGHVIYNPAFLQSREKGLSIYSFSEQKPETVSIKAHKDIDNELIVFLKKKKEQAVKQGVIIEAVNHFVDEYGKFFQKSQFASQWGSIRSFAMVYSEDEKLREAIEGFLTHGVKSEEWKERGRCDKLIGFLATTEFEGHLQEAVINLASEMAKICKS
mgnify:FL=1